jgi:catechol 2,3-dioxygenase
VSDRARSLDYYRNVIGMAVVEDDGSAIRLGAHGGSEVLVELHERRGARPASPHGRLGLYHFALLVPDRPSLGRFAAHLADMDARVASADHLVSEALYLWDPDGLGIEVYTDRPRAGWRTVGSELAMATDRLDVRDLIRAGKSVPWHGLPGGTVVGHVHLHVGSLVDAEALYHAALGFDKMVWSYPGALFLAAGGYHHHLAVNTWAEGAPIAGDDDARLLEWELRLPDATDVAAARENLTRSGYRVEIDGDAARLTAPWGIRLRLRPAA